MRYAAALHSTRYESLYKIRIVLYHAPTVTKNKSSSQLNVEFRVSANWWKKVCDFLFPNLIFVDPLANGDQLAKVNVDFFKFMFAKRGGGSTATQLYIHLWDDPSLTTCYGSRYGSPRRHWWISQRIG